MDVDRYISREFHDREVRSLEQGLAYAVWTYDIPNPGDVHVYRIVDRSVLIIRQPDMSLKAFVNSCLHRGSECCKSDTHRTQLRCPYHGFTWSLQANSNGTPRSGIFRRSRLKSSTCRRSGWRNGSGFVFINFDKDAAPLKEYMGGMYAAVGRRASHGRVGFQEQV